MEKYITKIIYAGCLVVGMAISSYVTYDHMESRISELEEKIKESVNLPDHLNAS